jgi:hypothetical protein
MILSIWSEKKGIISKKVVSILRIVLEILLLGNFKNIKS